jgi:hypothetical protein
MNESKEKLEKAKIFLELALNTDQIIQQANKRLTEKVRSIFAVTSTLVPIVVGLGYFILKETKAYLILLPIFLSLVMFLLAITLGVWVQKPTHYKYVDPRVIAKKYRGKGKSLRFFVNKWASAWSDTANYNASVVNKKEDVLKCMYTLVAIGLGILAVSFLLLAFSMMN